LQYLPSSALYLALRQFFFMTGAHDFHDFLALDGMRKDPRRKGVCIAVVACLHLALAMGLMFTAPPPLRHAAHTVSVLSAHLVDDISTPPALAPTPALPQPHSVAPPRWQSPLVPEMPTPAPVQHQATRSVELVDPPAAPALAAANANAPTQTTQPPVLVPQAVPPAPRQVAITQVAYLEPPLLVYPLAARRQRLEGLVHVRVHVDEQGRPKEVVVALSSGHDVLDAAALQTVHATRFKPYTENGVAKPFLVLMPLSFELES
jgi:periplasmic protein TonB